MAAYGLDLPTSPVAGGPPGASPAVQTPRAQVINIGGFLRTGNQADAMRPDADMQARMAAATAAAEAQSQPVIMGLAARVRQAFQDARAGRTVIEQEMLEALYARRGEYTPAKKAQIEEQDQPLIYMMLASGKMRQVESLMRDVLLGTGADKPWTIQPTPDPEMPPSAVQAAMQQLVMEIQQAMMSGFQPSMQAAQERLRQIRDEMSPLIMEEARKRAERMERKMEDQLIEGGFIDAIDQFITDMATFKTAFLVGPVLRKKPKLTWGEGGELQVTEAIKLEWERKSPFDVYPASWASNIQDGPLCIKHRLSRLALTEMIGVEGYSEASIRKVLEQFGTKGLREWLSVESQQAVAEGKLSGYAENSDLIDALQYFGTASGQMLIDWGMDASQVADPAKEYQVESWVIGPYVIKAVLNADPLARRGVYAWSFQAVPGSVWGNSPYDLMKDCQDMCNGAARALAANMGIASGPQVWYMEDRVPANTDVTRMYPWKMWPVTSDATGSTAAPMGFFQPSSNANELMAVYERFSLLADEYTGIPRYMAGFNGGEGGAGRTASGISMMISNASKVIKQVLGGADRAIAQLLDRLYYHNMRYGDDPDLKGDVVIVSRGASSLVAKEAAQQRSNEFLQVALASPQVGQIIGQEGLAELLRPIVKRLDLNADKVVPPLQVLRQRMAEQAQQQMLMMAQQGGAPGQPGQPGAPGGTPAKPRPGEQLQNGAPTTDQFSPQGA